MASSSSSAQKRPRPAAADSAADHVVVVAPAGTKDVAKFNRVVAELQTRQAAYPVNTLQRKLNIPAPELLEYLQTLGNMHRLEFFTIRSATGPNETVVKWHLEDHFQRIRDLATDEVAILALVEKAGNSGLWVRNLKLNTKLPTQVLNKILKKLEKRELIKQVKSMAFKNRRMYMMFNLEPTKDVTGGIWYRDQTLDETLVDDVGKAVVRAFAEQVRMGGRDYITPAATVHLLNGQPSIKSRIGGRKLTSHDAEQILEMLVADDFLQREATMEETGRAFSRATLAVYRDVPKVLESHLSDPSGNGVMTASSGGGSRSAPRGGKAPRGGMVIADDSDNDDEEPQTSNNKRKAAGGSDDDDDDDEDDEEEDDDGTGTHYKLPGVAGSELDRVTEMPCGACPVISKCSPSGLVSPQTCVYLNKWLEF